MRHGGRSRYVAAGLMPEQAEALAALAERQVAIETDLGGRDELSILAHDLVTDYLRLRLVADWLADNLIREGPLTGKGRQRAALTAFLQVVDRLHRLSMALGLERRPKVIDVAEQLARLRLEQDRDATQKASQATPAPRGGPTDPAVEAQQGGAA